MPRQGWQSSPALRIAAVLLGAILLAHLVERAGTGALLENAKNIAWGLVLVIALAGIGHIVKTWAWRLTLRGEAKRISFWRMLGLRLISEAIGQLGFVGLVFGESARVTLLGSGVSTASAISSVAMDRGLFIVAGAIVTITGIAAAAFVVALSGALHVYAGIFVIAVAVLLGLAGLALHKGWPLFSKPARAVGRIPCFRSWIDSKKAVIECSERQFLQFHRQAPGGFWLSVILNLTSHVLAVTEVYLILHFLCAHASFVSALVLESLTKLINVIGAVNPGNLGTYEGGNMVIGKLVGLNGAQGLTLGLCRRARAIFWAVVGVICLAWFSRSNAQAKSDGSTESVTGANLCS
jgi:hypothetical protein